jgi:hypothetical protein
MKPKLMAEQCETCVFLPGNVMGLRKGRLKGMIENCLSEGDYFACHETLSYGQHPEVGEAMCRGLYDAFGPQINLVRIYERLGGFDEVKISKPGTD